MLCYRHSKSSPYKSDDPYRYEQEDEWHEFLEKTDTLEGLGLAGGGGGGGGFLAVFTGVCRCFFRVCFFGFRGFRGF